MTEKWQEWEHHVQETLGLDGTICSGNKFNDPGDATSNVNPRDDSFRLLVDCKYTEKMTFSLNLVSFKLWLLRGAERGKRAMMAIRLRPVGMRAGDFVVLSLDDFAELMGRLRRFEDVRNSMITQGMVDRTWLEREEYQGRGR